MRVILFCIVLLLLGVRIAHAQIRASDPICKLADSAGADDVVEGAVSLAYADDFAHGTSEIYCLVFEQSKKRTTQIRWKGRENFLPKAGSIARFRGKRIDNNLCVSDDFGAVMLLSEPPPEQTESVLSSAAEPKILRVLVVVVARVPNTQLSDTNRNVILDAFNRSGLGADSVNNVYWESSYGMVGFQAEVVGPIALPNNSNCPYMADDANFRATGVNLSKYELIAYTYVDPQSREAMLNQCPFAGIAVVGGLVRPQPSWNLYYEGVQLYTHEIGHNLGLGHARTIDWEYGDPTSPMGVASKVQFNAINRMVLGWANFTEVTQPGSYRLHPLEVDPALYQDAGPAVIKVKDEYLSYRAAIGLDKNLNRGKEELSLHGAPGANGSMFLGSAGDGASLRLKTFSATNIRHLPDGTLGFDLAFRSCVPAAPTLSFDPPSLDNVKAGVQYGITATLTNADTGDCHATTYDLNALTPADYASSCTFSANAETRSMQVTLKPNESKVFDVYFTATDKSINGSVAVSATADALSATSSFDYRTDRWCRRTPTVTVASPSQTFDAQLTPLTYAIDVKDNNWESFCSSVTYSIVFGTPIGLGVRATPAPFVVEHNASGRLSVVISASSSPPPPGTYPVALQFQYPATPVGQVSTSIQVTVPNTLSTGPSAPSIKGAYDSASQKLRLNWEASVSLVGIARYEILKDGAKIYAVPASQTAFAQRAPRDTVTHLYAVRAVDTQGKKATSNALQFLYPNGFIPL